MELLMQSNNQPANRATKKRIQGSQRFVTAVFAALPISECFSCLYGGLSQKNVKEKDTASADLEFMTAIRDRSAVSISLTCRCSPFCSGWLRCFRVCQVPLPRPLPRSRCDDLGDLFAFMFVLVVIYRA